MFDYKANYKKDKAERDQLTNEHSLWIRLEGKKLTDEQVNFPIISCTNIIRIRK